MYDIPIDEIEEDIDGNYAFYSEQFFIGEAIDGEMIDEDVDGEPLEEEESKKSNNLLGIDNK